MKQIFILFLMLSNWGPLLLAQIELDPERVRVLQNMSQEFHEQYILNRSRAVEFAQQNNMPIRATLPSGQVIELQQLVRGVPKYYITYNYIAAQTVSTDHVWSAPYSLTGNGMLIGEWDGGDVRTTHTELTGRVTDGDGSTSQSWHSTGVAGTLIASGVNSNAKGMAPDATLNAYDWNDDLNEMTTEASAGLMISNHSYGSVTGWAEGDFGQGQGWYWWGDIDVSTTESVFFGRYSEAARDHDDLALNAPYYLIVYAAGNDRGEEPPAGVTDFWALSSSAGWIWVSTTTRFPADGQYDCISDVALAKNILTVGAIEDIPGGYTGTSDAVMSSFSTWGPCDDGRIKPDIVANGTGLTTSGSSGDTDYVSATGTSFAAPNATGSLVLLQQHYNATHGPDWMLSSTLKALAIHTADETGAAPGPDYEFGWGLLNTQKAADLIDADVTEDYHIQELSLSNGSTLSQEYFCPGIEDIRVTLVWNDPPGSPPPLDQLDSNTPMLINDLDLRLERNSDGTLIYPWVLDRDNPSNPAARAENNIDNVEQVFLDVAGGLQAGSYTLHIDHDGTLNSTQDFSLVISGLQEEFGDFGDAPEGSLAYPSTAVIGAFPTCMNVTVSNWIQHYMGNIFFGTSWDPEQEGNAGSCPLFNPNTYDMDECMSDGDAGLLIPPSYTIQGATGSEIVVPCVPGNTGALGGTCQPVVWGSDIDISVTNNRSTPAYVNVIIDWDQNGQWGGTSTCASGAVPEYVLIDFTVPGNFTGQLSQLSPPGFTVGPQAGYVWARFTISERQISNPSWNGEGLFEDGETEDYMLFIEEFDFGDAPDPGYPTLVANNGASHVILPGVFMGGSIDAEGNGQPTAVADGDDINGAIPDDEDGVVFMSTLSPGNIAHISVSASVSGLLNAWIDFNGSNGWADAGEQIFTDQPLNAGQNNLSFTVPATALATTTFARFRFSTVAGLSYTGQAVDGEVEDYQVSIVTDSDGDGISDNVEGTGDRDGDGVSNPLDYDPSGYIYDENTGQIISGGQISVTGPPGAAITILYDGSTGFYQFLTDGTAGTYTLSLSTLPSGYYLSPTCTAQGSALDPPAGPGVYMVGAGEDGSTGTLTDYSCTNNPYYTQFNLQAGDQYVINNNFPINNVIAIELSSFNATCEKGEIHLEWITQSETENLGFHLFRSLVETGKFEQITSSMIEGMGNSSHEQSYQYIDTDVRNNETYYYKLADYDYNGKTTFHGPVSVKASIPTAFKLDQNYPNPFNPETTISYHLNKAGQCELVIYNINGQVVRDLVSEYANSGSYSVKWDGRDNSGLIVPSGVYLYQLKMDNQIETRKMHFLK